MSNNNTTLSDLKVNWMLCAHRGKEQYSTIDLLRERSHLLYKLLFKVVLWGQKQNNYIYPQFTEEK